MNNDDIVFVQLDTWNNMKDATKYLEELEDSKYDDEINYSEVWYDMAIIYCITTTESYIEKHPELKQHIVSDTYMSTTIFAPYFPEYNPYNFGKQYCGEYEDWPPYKDFNKQVAEHFKNQQWEKCNKCGDYEYCAGNYGTNKCTGFMPGNTIEDYDN